VTSLLAAIDAGYFKAIGEGVGAIVLYAILGVGLVLVGFYAVDLTTPGKLNDLVRAGAPNAVAVTAAGMVSMALIIVTAVWVSGGRLAEGLLNALIFGLADLGHGQPAVLAVCIQDGGLWHTGFCRQDHEHCGLPRHRHAG